jgi:hypothetical protein
LWDKRDYVPKKLARASPQEISRATISRMQPEGVQIVWEFRARAGREAEFEHEYGSPGVWTQFFDRSPDYRGTTLARDTDEARRYLLIDCWSSLAAFERFKAECLVDYQALDLRCAALTESETCWGSFALRPGSKP